MAQQQTLHILCVDQGCRLASQVAGLFPDKSVRVTLEKNIDRALELFEQSFVDVLILTSAVDSGDKMDGMELLEVITEKSPGTQILFLIQPGEFEMAMSALKAGTYQYATLPVDGQELRLLIETALDQRPEYAPNLLLKTEGGKNKFEQMVGGSSVMRGVYRQIRQAAATDIPVVISGETGTGKDLAAQAIHQISSRADNIYLPVHLGALPQELVASELFGHEKGAFTGADDRYRGSFEQAASGTVFLDEISTISDRVQISLLRLLEGKEFYRIGGHTPIKTDVRIIAASNEDLLETVNRGEFREDLYFRLEVLHIDMPPLRSRHGDILLLIQHFMNQYAATYQKKIPGISPECLNLMTSYDWPGNVRELKNVIIRAVVMCHGEILLPEHLPDRIRFGRPEKPMVNLCVGLKLSEVEREMIVRTLEFTGNNRKRTAQILGVSRRALYNKIHRHGI